MKNYSLILLLGVMIMSLTSFKKQEDKKPKDGIIQRVKREQVADTFSNRKMQERAPSSQSMDSSARLKTKELQPLPDTIGKGMH